MLAIGNTCQGVGVSGPNTIIGGTEAGAGNLISGNAQGPDPTPFCPAGHKAADWFQKLFVDEPHNYSLRPYDREQWDVIFFVQGVAEMILRDVRAGLSSRTMRFFVDGDNHRGYNNVGVVIPPGVAHAIRVERSEDVIMVYGTSTSFRPEFEGRIASGIETAELPESWRKFLSL